MQGRFNTAYDCSMTCYDAGFKYSGRQYIGECWCGNSGYDKYGSSDKCNDCDSFNVGGWLSCVYEAVIESPAPTPSPSPEAPDIPTISPSATASSVIPTSAPIIFVPTDIPSSMPSSSPVSIPVSTLHHIKVMIDKFIRNIIIESNLTLIKVQILRSRIIHTIGRGNIQTPWLFLG